MTAPDHWFPAVDLLLENGLWWGDGNCHRFFFENWVSGVSPVAEQKTGQSDRKRN
jgi:hypothetical protein